ncbi:hypothetical protein [Streptomyces sp. NPDC001380]|uniref:hypothetical protein n=1 Tax=Streptomyces sp. NPDC001380 TaxID=3364566 RepID=UPI0036884084
MTAPNTPPGPGRPTAPGTEPPAPQPAGAPGQGPRTPGDPAQWTPPSGAAHPGPQPPAAAHGYGYGQPGLPSVPPAEQPPRNPGAEVRVGALAAAGSLLAGLAVGLLWLWLAPRVPLYADTRAVYLKDPEGEQRAAADGVFALLGLGAGALCALTAFLLTRRRGGGVAVAVGLALGGLLGAVAAWRLGIALGPTSDMVAHARQVGEGRVFDAALQLGAKGALLVWPMTAMVVLLGLTAAFGRREPEPGPYWHGVPQSPQSPQFPQPPQPPLPAAEH